ncbi:M48 family metallopeptidase [Flavobacterium sp. GT3R68]|uniref:M48 family metallopeptidase n=1 Tax=Flavobacterium sp. GT3R68 TaxID=2594437 RepID=UPI000F8842D8|nr:M48 family metalloprotease [Flavobacterium sp. GT3R68]RTY88512.1 hypothetical protein EKL32_24965 [Flavobacterium sp. GSN2]
MQKTILTALFSLSFLFTLAQEKTFSYIPKNKDSIFSYVTKVNEIKKSKFDGKYKKEIKEIITERNTDFIKTIKDSNYIFDSKISGYLNKILGEIYKSNPDLKTADNYFFISKSPIPNAASYGNGIFTVNLGLFNLVQSDDELASILSHEIAHQTLEHVDKSMLSYIEKINSKETKKKIKEVTKKEFGKRQAVSDLIKDLNYNFLRRTRKAESQADSLGLVIFSKTKYKKSASLDALKRLDFVNDMIFNEPVNLKNHFDFSEYPFKEAWLAKDQNLFDIKESANDYAMDKDSVKTHPDIPIRLELLKKFVNEDNSTAQPSSEIQAIKKIAADNSIEIFMTESRIDWALYQTLLMYNQKQLDEKIYCNNVSQILKKTYEFKNKHLFGKYVGLINGFSDEKNLDEVKQFLHNIELKSIKKIGLQFCMKYQTVMQNDPDFIKTTEFFTKLNQ